jgi:hypothetical protein
LRAAHMSGVMRVGTFMMTPPMSTPMLCIESSPCFE